MFYKLSNLMISYLVILAYKMLPPKINKRFSLFSMGSLRVQYHININLKHENPGFLPSIFVLYYQNQMLTLCWF